MALGGIDDFISRALVVIEADNRAYLKAKQQMEAADKRQSEKQLAQLAAALKAQNKLTEANFATGKAALESGKSLDVAIAKATGQSKLLSKGLEVAGGRLKAMGMSLLSGLGAGIIGGIVGGSISSIVQKAFAPPTDADLKQMARYGQAVNVLGVNMKAYADEEARRRQIAEARKAGISDADQAVEAVTHATAKRNLGMAIEELNDKLLNHEITVDVYNASLANLKKTFADATGETERLKKAQEALNDTWTTSRVEGFVGTLTRGLGAWKKAQDDYDAKKEKRIAAAKQEQAAIEALAAAYGRTITASAESSRRAVEHAARRKELGIYSESELGTEGSVYGGREEDLPGGTLDAEIAFYDQAKPKQTWLEKTVGPVSDFDLYAAAFSTLAGEATAAYDALVDGTAGAGQAAAKLVQGVVKGLGKQFFVEGLGQTARALASLAGHDYADAALHAKSAAAFFGGAAAAGFIASGMGSGGSGGGGGGGGGGRGGGSSVDIGSGGGGGGGRSTVIVYTSVDDSDSARVRDRKIQEQVGRALGRHGVRDG